MIDASIDRALEVKVGTGLQEQLHAHDLEVHRIGTGQCQRVGAGHIVANLNVGNLHRRSRRRVLGQTGHHVRQTHRGGCLVDVGDVDGDECGIDQYAVAGLDGEHVLTRGLVVEVGVVDDGDLSRVSVDAKYAVGVAAGNGVGQGVAILIGIDAGVGVVDIVDARTVGQVLVDSYNVVIDDRPVAILIPQKQERLILYLARVSFLLIWRAKPVAVP